MGGYLAQPAKFYPHLFSADGIFGNYPYLLPNLVSVIIIVIAILQGIVFLEETNPPSALKSNAGEEAEAEEEEDEFTVDERTPFMRRGRANTASGAIAARSRTRSIVDSIREAREHGTFQEHGLPTATEQCFDLRRSSFGTMNSVKIRQDLRSNHSFDRETLKRATFNFTVIMLTISLILISYHQMAFASLLPIYLLDTPDKPLGELDLTGGLGYTVHDVGACMAVNGVIALVIQALIFPIFVQTIGVWHSFLWTTILFPISYVIMPFLSALPPDWVTAAIYISLFIQNLFGIIAIPCALILLKNAAPSSQVLGRVNGLAMSGCCAARTVSPPLAGILYSVGGSATAWFSCAAFAILGVVQLYWMPRKHIDVVAIENALKLRAEGGEGGATANNERYA
jgi:hypothetical protein